MKVHTFCKTTHFVLAISKQFLSRSNWKILHLTEFFTQPAVVMVVTNSGYAGGVAVLDPGCTFFGIADASYEVVSRINPGCVLNAPQLLQTLTSLNLFSSQSVLFGLLHWMKCVAKQCEKH